MDEPVLILASRSRRRLDLLLDAGYEPVQEPSPFEDPPQPDGGVADPAELTRRMATRKAEALVESGVFQRYPQGLIVAADTVVVDPVGRLIGQPANADDARLMLKSLAGKSHRVVTTVVVRSLDDDSPAVLTDQATVRMGELPMDQIDKYVDSDDWQGKAGGYNLTERLKAGWEFQVEGDPTTVVGLPMRRLAAHLLDRGFLPDNHSDHRALPAQIVSTATETASIIKLPRAASFERRMLDIMSGRDTSAKATAARLGLLLLTPAYRAGIALHNWRFDSGLRHIVRLDRPVVSIGNITTGGVGKTPMVILLAQKLLKLGAFPAILTRGYKATLRGADEAMVMARELGPAVPVAVNPSRKIAAAKLLAKHPQTTVLLMDDAFQHRQIHRDVDLILIDATNPFGYERLLPRGLLREPLRALRRADAIVITRTDQVPPEQLAQIDTRIAQITGWPPIAHAVHRWTGWRSREVCDCGYKLGPESQAPLQRLRKARVLAVTAIGNPEAFALSLEANVAAIASLIPFPDHHPYRYEDLIAIFREARRLGINNIVTTEKDWMKWQILMENLPHNLISEPLLVLLDRSERLTVWRPHLSMELVGGDAAVTGLVRELVRP